VEQLLLGLRQLGLDEAAALAVQKVNASFVSVKQQHGDVVLSQWRLQSCMHGRSASSANFV
jgi:hypothetical protein